MNPSYGAKIAPVSKVFGYLLALSVLVFPRDVVFASQQANSRQSLDQKFQSAAAQYESGHSSEAATQLESLLRQAPDSFEIHELLGLAYSAQSHDDKGNPHLQKAVRLKPSDVAARTNLALPMAPNYGSDVARAVAQALGVRARDAAAGERT